MPEEVLFEAEKEQNLTDIATYFQQIASNLNAGGDITLRSGEQSVTLSPPIRPTFEVKVEREGPTDGDAELSIEFELEWHESGEMASEGDKSLEIE